MVHGSCSLVEHLGFSPLCKFFLLPSGFLRYSTDLVSSNDLRASVNGFKNSIYRCCKDIQDGEQALRAFLARQTPSDDTPSAVLELSHEPESHPISITTTAGTDQKWWCCFAGAEPGVYLGLYVYPKSLRFDLLMTARLVSV